MHIIADFFRPGYQYRLTRTCPAGLIPDQVIEFTASENTVKTSGRNRHTVATGRGYFCYDSADKPTCFNGRLRIIVAAPSGRTWTDTYETIPCKS